MWSFDRLRDANKIETEEINWKGPLAWPGFESINKLESIPDMSGVYLITFDFKEEYLLYGAGITKSTRQRISTHSREYRKGNYTVLDIDSAVLGERREIWHGWNYVKTHQEEFISRKATILEAVENQLQAFRIFVAEVSDVRKRERIEAAIMHNLYSSKEYWSELADRGMFLKERWNSEMPILITNKSSMKIFGIPDFLEI